MLYFNMILENIFIAKKVLHNFSFGFNARFLGGSVGRKEKYETRGANFLAAKSSRIHPLSFFSFFQGG